MAFVEFFNIPLEELAGNGIRIAAGTAVLTDAIKTTVSTGLTKVQFAMSAPSVDPATSFVFGLITTDEGSGDIGITCTSGLGSRTANWFAIGY